MGLIGLVYQYGIVLQAISIIHFIRRRPDTFWLWVIIIGGGIGALVYIAAEVIPDAGLLRGSLNRLSRRQRIRSLEAMILVNPAVGNREELADLCLEEGSFARARELYDSVITARTDSLDPFYRRALAELALSDVEAALKDLEQVVSRDPKYDFHRAIGLFAHANSLAGHADRAEKLFQDATEISTLSETYYNYASFLASQQRASEAREWAQRILAKKPTMPGYLRRRERPWFRKAKALLKRLPAQ
jgi:hypothetical protein